MRKLVLIAFFALSACVTQVREQVPQTITQNAGAAAVSLSAINAQRAASGLPALRQDAALERAALAHAKDMAARGYFSHTAPNGSTPRRRLLAAGDCGLMTGENIAQGYRTVGEVTTVWMNSAGHRANILNRGFARGGLVQVGDLWVMTFSGAC